MAAGRGGRGGSARFGPVESRSVTGSGEWIAVQAVGLLEQGYGVDRVVELTGFDRRWVRHQSTRLTGGPGRDELNG